MRLCKTEVLSTVNYITIEIQAKGFLGQVFEICWCDVLGISRPHIQGIPSSATSKFKQLQTESTLSDKKY